MAYTWLPEWNPNMAAPANGWSLGQLLMPNYLGGRPWEENSTGPLALDPNDIEGSFLSRTGSDIRTALRDLAPGYNLGAGPIDANTLNQIVPFDQQRAPAKEDPLETMIGFGVPALLGAGIAGWANAAGSAASGGGMDWWGTDYMGDFGVPDVSNAYNPVAANDPIGELIRQLDGGASSADALKAVEASLPGTTRSALEQLLFEAGSGASNLLKSGGSALSKLFGGDAGSLFGTGGNTGGLFGSLFGNGGMGSFFDKAAASAPVLAAIQYARNQSPLDTGKLEGLYGSFDPNALAFGYDQNTVAGRESLTSGLTNRGVMGSSFGNNDITNFNTTRDLGRSALVNQGMGQRTDIAKAIMDANFKSQQLKNNLYGSSLLALGNVFGGRSSPSINFGNP